MSAAEELPTRTLRDYLQEIYDRHGRLTPALVVDTASDESHPLHAIVFDRPVEDAARAYYLGRAQELITRIKVRYKEGDTGKSEIRQWHAVRTEVGMVYEPAEKIANSEFLSTMLLQEMERDWKALYARYEGMKEFVALVRNTLEDVA